jgi:hypothetical protein
MRNFVPTPSNIPPTSPFYSSTSQMHHFTTSNLCKYLVMKPKLSFQMCPSDIDDSSLAIFLTYNFKVFIYHSMGYIHLIVTKLHKSNPFTKWYSKCVMMWKKEGGKSISSKAKLIATLYRNYSISKGFQTLWQCLVNTLGIHMMTIWSLGVNTFQCQWHFLLH